MSFLESYKSLDNLCRDVLRADNGVTAYISEMEKCSTFSGSVAGWDADYHKLKHYRHIRNQIAHEDIANDFCGKLTFLKKQYSA